MTIEEAFAWCQCERAVIVPRRGRVVLLLQDGKIAKGETLQEAVQAAQRIERDRQEG